MRFTYFTTSLIIVSTLLIGQAFRHSLAFPDATWPLDKGERISLLPGTTLTQAFTGNRDSLHRIEILFGEFSLKKTDTLTLELRDGDCLSTTLLAHTTLSHQSFSSDQPYIFVFNTIERAQGKVFCLTLHFESTNEMSSKQKMPRVFTDPSAHGEPHILYIHSDALVGASPIAIRPGYLNSSFGSTWHELTERISQYKPTFLKGDVVTVLALMSLILTLGTAVLLTSEKRRT